VEIRSLVSRHGQASRSLESRCTPRLHSRRFSKLNRGAWNEETDKGVGDGDAPHEAGHSARGHVRRIQQATEFGPSDLAAKPRGEQTAKERSHLALIASLENEVNHFGKLL